VEALTILTSLSIEVREFAAALSSCRLALAKGAHRQMRWDLLRYVVQASLGLNDRESVLAHLPSLVAEVEHMPDPWQEAQGRRVIGEAFAYLGRKEGAAQYFEQSRSIAARTGYPELRYWADEAMENLSRSQPTRSTSRAIHKATPQFALNDASQAVIEQLSCLAVA